jgi:2,3-bisphosphoglycerate-independent phosphoglycerate mutase
LSKQRLNVTIYKHTSRFDLGSAKNLLEVEPPTGLKYNFKTFMYKPVVLVVLDGWGLGKNVKGNAIAEAKLPTIDKINQFYPHAALQASGISVGLPWGEVGNSEVGHITLGAGKIIYQSMPRITMAVQNGEFFGNATFLKAINSAKEKDSAMHIMGLVSHGGVHSYIDHLYALLEMMRDQKMEKVFVHVFTDGRDSSPNSGVVVLQELQRRMFSLKIGKIATVCGRYFAMDRNNNWDRTEKAYNAIVRGEGNQIESPLVYLQESYKKEIFDEFMEPAVVTENGQPIGKISDNDSVIFFNFREDRARQLTEAFAIPGFSKFKREQIKNLDFVTMTQYEDGLPVSVAFPPEHVENPLGKIISKKDLKQLRIAETEKFAHVTYFFNGGNEEPYPGEERVIVPSKNTDSFAKVPEMSAKEINDKVIYALDQNKYAFILINYANADIVGHTGDEKATIKAVEFVDSILAELIPAVLAKNGCLLITADHGNAEELKNNQTGEPDTEHSINPVPVWFVTPENHYKTAHAVPLDNIDASGLLSDIAPTVLELLGLKKPDDMTGESLLNILK